MKKVKVLLNFIQYSVAEKLAFYRSIVAKLTNNPAFPSPDVALTDVKTALDSFEAAIVAARNGGPAATSTMHDNEKAVDTLFRHLAHYVDKIADGDETTLLSSGFQESKQPNTHQKPPLAVSDGSHSGSVKLVAKAVEKAGSYVWQYAKDALPAADSDWLPITTTTHAHYELSGLAVAATYYFRVAAVTPSGITDFCPPVAKLVV